MFRFMTFLKHIKRIISNNEGFSFERIVSFQNTLLPMGQNHRFTRDSKQKGVYCFDTHFLFK